MNISHLKNKKLPAGPGIYFFKKGKFILYIGKATSLKDRVKSYFSADLFQTRGPLIVDMVSQADKIDFIKTGSVLEAIILEANLIKKHQPKYNTKEKDNKSFNFAIITKEDFPRVLIVRGREIEKGLPYKIKSKFGPFTSGESLKNVLKISRKMFPFRDRCVPYNSNVGVDNKDAVVPLLSTPVRRTRQCFNRQLGLCPGVCDGSIGKKDYLKTIRKIEALLSGKIGSLKNSLRREMTIFSKRQAFEKAGEIKRQIFSLEHIQDVALIREESTTSSSECHPSLQDLYTSRFPSTEYSKSCALGPTPKLTLTKEGKGEVLLSPPILRRSTESARGGGMRIEAYDVAHLSGTNNVGVMVVMENGELKRSDYRKFKIRNSKGSDVGALQEILERRLKHAEWPYPDLIVVDGGLAQLNIAKKDLNKSLALGTHKGLAFVSIVAVTKDEHHKAKAIIGLEHVSKNLSRSKYSDTLLLGYKKEILLINNEAHRFAIKYHRSKRERLDLKND